MQQGSILHHLHDGRKVSSQEIDGQNRLWYTIINHDGSVVQELAIHNRITNFTPLGVRKIRRNMLLPDGTLLQDEQIDAHLEKQKKQQGTV